MFKKGLAWIHFIQIKNILFYNHHFPRNTNLLLTPYQQSYRYHLFHLIILNLDMLLSCSSQDNRLV
jgi:hypothetical protein